MQNKVRNYSMLPMIAICLIFCFSESVIANDQSNVTNLTAQQFIALQLKQMSPAQRKEAIWTYARHRNYIYSPELWEIPEPLIILDAVLQSQEPYTSVMLEALERSLPTFPSKRSQLHAAAILYRYHHTMGENYLRQEVQKHGNARAAAIFARNQEITLLPQILKIAREQPDESVDIVAYLALWPAPAVTQGLLANFHADSENCNYAIALARQNAVQSLPVTRKLYSNLLTTDPAKVDLAAALIKLHDPRDNNLLASFSRMLKSNKSPGMMKIFTIQSLGDVQESRSIPLMEYAINNYLALPKVAKDDTNPIGAEQLAVSAAESLAKLQAPAGRKIVTRLLLNLGSCKADRSLLIRTSRALLSFHGSPDAVRQILGAKWIQQELAIYKLGKTLRPLPDEFMPPNNAVLP